MNKNSSHACTFTNRYYAIISQAVDRIYVSDQEITFMKYRLFLGIFMKEGV